MNIFDSIIDRLNSRARLLSHVGGLASLDGLEKNQRSVAAAAFVVPGNVAAHGDAKVGIGDTTQQIEQVVQILLFNTSRGGKRANVAGLQDMHDEVLTILLGFKPLPADLNWTPLRFLQSGFETPDETSTVVNNVMEFSSLRNIRAIT